MITEFIPEGAEKAIKREELVEKTGMSDRKVRKAIEEARRTGMIILNEGDGYYTTDDLNAMYREYKRETARALSILKTRKALRKKLKDAGYPVRK